MKHFKFGVAMMLELRGRCTVCVGKWRVGHLPEFLPTVRPSAAGQKSLPCCCEDRA